MAAISAYAHTSHTFVGRTGLLLSVQHFTQLALRALDGALDTLGQLQQSGVLPERARPFGSPGVEKRLFVRLV